MKIPHCHLLYSLPLSMLPNPNHRNYPEDHLPGAMVLKPFKATIKLECLSMAGFSGLI